MRNIFRIFVFIFAAVAMFCCATLKAAETRTAENEFIFNTSQGLFLGLEIAGKKVSLEQKARIHDIVEEQSKLLVARLKKIGLYEQWSTQILDPEIQKLNRAALDCHESDEVKKLMDTQIAIINKKYPGLIEKIENDREINQITRRIFRRAIKIVGD